MDRRKSIKALIVGTVTSGVLVEACKLEDKKIPALQQKTEGPSTEGTINRMLEEKEHFKDVVSKTFFTAAEMATITILVDIIIPKDDNSGSATDAKLFEKIYRA